MKDQSSKTSDLTLDLLVDIINKPIKIACFYNSVLKVSENKSIWYYPSENRYRIFQYNVEVFGSFLADAAIEYYNELTF